MTPEDKLALVAAARQASEGAYAPYSQFKVGAAALDEMGRIHVGCNVENASYGLTICAERNAIGAMVAAGGRRLIAMALHTPTDKPSSPCGACRQVLVEFGREATILCASRDGTVAEHTALELLPEAFEF